MPTDRPNIILINCDDLGYGDIGCYGSTVNRTPHLDRMAAEGLRLTDFYMASPVCSPSRGGMLTGCYPNRISFDMFQGHWVLFPGMSVGLNPEERTIASLLKEQDYATKLIGKWHCGDQPAFLPTNHGFDSYYGIPYSNDMGRQSGNRSEWMAKLQEGNGYSYLGRDSEALDDNYPPLPLLRDDAVIQEQPDQAALTERYVEEAVRFMRDNQEQPFFLYFAHMYVHLPIYTPDAYLKQSQNGRYGAAVEHVDWSVGALLDELKRLGLDDNTLVIFTSDNGSRARGEGGSNAPLRGTKGTTWEGGQRLPCIVRWPGGIQPGQTSDQLCCSLDFLPTLVGLAGGEVPDDRVIDGLDCAAWWTGAEAESPRETFCYFHRGSLEAVRHGRWKWHLHKNGDDLNQLFDLSTDIAETTDVAAGHPEVVAQLQALAAAAQAELGDRAKGITGTAVRPVGSVDSPDVLTHYDPDHPYIMAEYDLSDAG